MINYMIANDEQTLAGVAGTVSDGFQPAC